MHRHARTCMLRGQVGNQSNVLIYFSLTHTHTRTYTCIRVACAKEEPAKKRSRRSEQNWNNNKARCAVAVAVAASSWLQRASRARANNNSNNKRSSTGCFGSIFHFVPFAELLFGVCPTHAASGSRWTHFSRVYCLLPHRLPAGRRRRQCSACVRRC